MTARNLVVLFDGTWNRSGDPDDNETNVVKLYRLLQDSYVPNVHYDEGVGVKSGEEILGGVFGAGIDDRILSAYSFLQSRYSDKGFENRLFVFGFSRGAYTARTFAQLLYYCGVPTPKGNLQKAWNCYLSQDLQAAGELKKSGKFFDVDIEMLGVWDTVKSTLDPDRKDSTLHPNVKSAYHAMSIDEKRRNFPILRFLPEDARISQVWFAGVHSDIGGGYLEPQAQLADITLDWMIGAALKHGMEFIPDYRDYLAPNPKGMIHESYQGMRVPLGEKVRRIEADDKIHSSVKSRLESVADYRPPNLPANPVYV